MSRLRPAASPAGSLSPSAALRYLQDLQRFGIKLGLDNMRILLAAFGDPHRDFPVVHVAGTNGKGSISAMLAEIFARSGFKAGLYTSPHLVRVEERIRVGGRMIPGRDFRRILGAVKAGIEELLAAGRLDASPTFFEVLTAAALLYFRERRVDVAVLEVGMGGRFDATNVVTPVVSVVANVARDHMQYLGNTLEKIAFEKAGIIKPGVPVVSGVVGGQARPVIRRRAREENAPLTEVFGRDSSFDAGIGIFRKTAVYRLRDETYRLAPGLPGAHQVRNAAVAAATSSVLKRLGFPIDRKIVELGIRSARWEGRLELVARRPRVYLDGAHNEDGALALAAFIDETCPKPPVLVFAMMKDKALARVAGILFPRASRIVLTAIPYPRAALPKEVLAATRRFSGRIAVEPDPAEALRLARRMAGPAGTVVVTGSLFLVGEMKKIGFYG
ncbi:MAG: bifunctional folylpolyglutamate synthase/dihydrofolate synthase [Candidatus Aminicenantes bacterium]|nr:bifunctional folylpolyglutamate synthase/dihydrofolate synthase [Candidatus Aminicenantes bacterium]